MIKYCIQLPKVKQLKQNYIPIHPSNVMSQAPSLAANIFSHRDMAGWYDMIRGIIWDLPAAG